MPVVRTSARMWKMVSEKAGELGISLTYALDKVVDELIARVTELETMRDRPVQAVTDLQVQLEACRQECRDLKLKAEAEKAQIIADLKLKAEQEKEQIMARANTNLPRPWVLSERDVVKELRGTGRGPTKVVRDIYGRGFVVIRRPREGMGVGG